MGKVTEFLTIHEASRRRIELAKISKEGIHDVERRAQQLSNHSSFLFTERRQEQVPEYDLLPLNKNEFTHTSVWPLVHFTNGMQLLCAPIDFDVEGIKANVEARRLQVSLLSCSHFSSANSEPH